MSELLRFKTREAFREWLSENCRRREGVWLEFGKTKEVETLSANDALLEALCFGWIDGVMKKMDDTSYKKYFAPRRAGSKWSQKNKALVQELSMRCHDGIRTQENRRGEKERTVGQRRFSLCNQRGTDCGSCCLVKGKCTGLY